MQTWALVLPLVLLSLASLGHAAEKGIGLPWYNTTCPPSHPHEVTCSYGPFPSACFAKASSKIRYCCDCPTPTTCIPCRYSFRCDSFTHKCRSDFSYGLLGPIIVGSVFGIVILFFVCKCICCSGKKSTLAPGTTTTTIHMTSFTSPVTPVATTNTNVTTNATVNNAYSDVEEEDDEVNTIIPPTTYYHQAPFQPSTSAAASYQPSTSTYTPVVVSSYQPPVDSTNYGAVQEEEEYHEGYAE